MNYDKVATNFMNKYKNIMNSEDLYDLVEDDPEKKKDKPLDKKEKKILEKRKQIEKGKEKASARRNERILSSCRICFSNGFIQNEQILKMGTSVALIVPKQSNISDIYYLLILIKIEK